MMARFHENTSQFEALLVMIKQDQAKIGGGLFRIDDDWTKPKDLGAFGIDSNRVETYRKIFGAIGIPRGFYVYDGDAYYFVASSQGIAVSGTSKGFAWRRTVPEPLIEGDLDEYRSKKNFGYLAFRAI